MSDWQKDKKKIKRALGRLCPYMKIVSIGKSPESNEVEIVLKGGNSDWVYSQFHRLQKKFPEYKF